MRDVRFAWLEPPATTNTDKSFVYIHIIHLVQ